MKLATNTLKTRQGPAKYTYLSAIVASFSSLTARLTSALCRSVDMLKSKVQEYKICPVSLSCRLFDFRHGLTQVL